MWTQTEQISLNGLGTVINQIVVSNVTGIRQGFWLIIDPFSLSCEIRQVMNPDPIIGSSITLNAPVSNHPTNTVIFVTTSPVWDITLFGADPLNSPAINTKAINAAVTDCAKSDGGAVAIPKGTFDVTLKGSSGPCIDLQSLNNIKFVGDGMEVSVLRLAATNYGHSDVYLFNVGGCNGIEWHDLTLDGNIDGILTKPNNQGVPPQLHLIQLFNSTASVMERVTLRNSRNDGIKSIGCNGLHVVNCIFNNNRRNGLTGQFMVGEVWIKGCYFKNTKNSDIDLEPTSGLSPNQWLISENTFVRNPEGNGFLSLTLVGREFSSVDEDYVVSDNIFVGGSVLATNCRNVVFNNNIINSSSGDNSDLPFFASHIIDRFIFSNNTIVNNSKFDQALRIIGINTDSPQGMVVENNTIENGWIEFLDCSGGAITGNKIKLNPASFNPLTDGIKIKFDNAASWATVWNCGNLKISDNVITNAKRAGIIIQNKNDKDVEIKIALLKLIHIDGNLINNYKGQTQSLRYGIYMPNLVDTCYDKLLIGTANNIQNADVTISVKGNYTTSITEVPTTHIINGSPESVVAAPQGSLAVSKIREADNKFSKNKLLLPGTATTGWELTSEMGKQLLFKDTFSNITQQGYNLSTPPPLVSPSGQPLYHIIDENVLAAGWEENNALPPNNLLNIWRIDTANKIAVNGGNNPIATVNAVPDCELKMFVRAMSVPGASGNPRTGVVFRLSGSGGSMTYWRYVIQYLNAIPYLIVESVVGTTATLHKSQSLGTMPPSGRAVLKVLLKGDYLSFFYNDLLVWNLKSSLYATATKHGITSSNSSIWVEVFKIFVH